MVFLKSGRGSSVCKELTIPKTNSKTDLCSCPESLDSNAPVIKYRAFQQLQRKVLKYTRRKQEGSSTGSDRSINAVTSVNKSGVSRTWRYLTAVCRWIFILILAVVLLSAVQSEKRATNEDQQNAWQLALFQLLPARFLSRLTGFLNSLELASWLRVPVLGLYSWKFNCNMSEAAVEDLRKYASLGELFTRTLKPGVRNISEGQLVSPVDGKVLYCGPVVYGRMEQVKGVFYELFDFLGPEASLLMHSKQTNDPSGWEVNTNESRKEEFMNSGKHLYHIVMYLAPGDYHHFHSPANWTAKKRRHFSGDLLSVAPWVARTIPGLFSLNERAVLSGSWEHGYFSMTPVGAYNVGSIKLVHDEDLQTNIEEEVEMGEYRDKELIGVSIGKGERVGHFELGSSVVLIFEAPANFQFSVRFGQTLRYGQQLGTFR